MSKVGGAISGDEPKYQDEDDRSYNRNDDTHDQTVFPNATEPQVA
jgi:hypothetical protein